LLPLALRGRHIREKFAFARTAALAALGRHRDAHRVERVLDGITDRAQQKDGSLSSGLGYRHWRDSTVRCCSAAVSIDVPRFLFTGREQPVCKF